MASEKRIFDLDLDRCVGCFACVVACLDQNDIDPAEVRSWRDVVPVGAKHAFSGKPSYMSMACLHCEDAPCVIGCPTGALRKDEATGLTLADSSLCIGCHSCVMACPYGAPRFGPDGKIQKCQGCAERVEAGLMPACVRVCPVEALRFDTVENIEKEKKASMLRGLLKL